MNKIYSESINGIKKKNLLIFLYIILNTLQYKLFNVFLF